MRRSGLALEQHIAMQNKLKSTRGDETVLMVSQYGFYRKTEAESQSRVQQVSSLCDQSESVLCIHGALHVKSKCPNSNLEKKLSPINENSYLKGQRFFKRPDLKFKMALCSYKVVIAAASYTSYVLTVFAGI